MNPNDMEYNNVDLVLYFSDDSQHCDGIFVDLEKSKVEGIPSIKPAKDHKIDKPEFPSC